MNFPKSSLEFSHFPVMLKEVIKNWNYHEFCKIQETKFESLMDLIKQIFEENINKKKVVDELSN